MYNCKNLDAMTHRALIELGLLIPTTEEEVMWAMAAMERDGINPELPESLKEPPRMKYKSKPRTIEAEQYLDKPVKGMCEKPNCFLSGLAHVHTIHNNQPVKLEPGDYVIPEADGVHYYPCKPDVFEATYEVVV